MTQLTISGHTFEVAEDPSIAIGAVMTEGMAHALAQVRRENIRNNFAKRVKDAGENINGLQEELDKYVASYQFGVRQPGAPRVVRDPVEREAFKLIRSAISAAYRAKYNTGIDKELLEEKAQELFDVKGEDYLKQARVIVKAQEAAKKVAGDDNLGVAV